MGLLKRSALVLPNWDHAGEDPLEETWQSWHHMAPYGTHGMAWRKLNVGPSRRCYTHLQRTQWFTMARKLDSDRFDSAPLFLAATKAVFQRRNPCWLMMTVIVGGFLLPFIGNYHIWSIDGKLRLQYLVHLRRKGIPARLPWNVHGCAGTPGEEMHANWGTLKTKTVSPTQNGFQQTCLPSGKLSQNYGTSPCYQWVNPLFLSPKVLLEGRIWTHSRWIARGPTKDCGRRRLKVASFTGRVCPYP